MPLKLQQEELPTINLTSMIDVVFLLLIFFMVGTRFSDSDSHLTIDLPRANGNAVANRDSSSKTLTLRSDGTIELDAQRIGLSEIPRILSSVAASEPRTTVVIMSDSQAATGRFIEVYAAVKRTGLPTYIATQPDANMSR